MSYYTFIIILLLLSCNNNQKKEEVRLHENPYRNDRVEWIRPEILEKSDIIYPDSLRELKVIGTVWVECLIDTLGQIVKKRVIYSDDNRLNPLALQTVSNYKFSPGMINLKKIESIIVFPIQFK